MRDSLRAERLKLRRLRLPAIAAGAGLLIAGLVALSLAGAANRLSTEHDMETPWQNGVVGDATVTMILVLPMLATLLAALGWHVEHRGDMLKQLRLAPVPGWQIHLAKALLLQGLTALSLIIALVACLAGWHLLPSPLRTAMGVSTGAAYATLGWTALVLYFAALPAGIIQFLLSARMPNVLHPVGIGLALTFSSLMIYGPTTARYLPYAWPGTVVMGNFPPVAAAEEQRPDASFRPAPGGLAGARPGSGAILFDTGHGNRHGPADSLSWIATAAGEAGIPVATSGAPLSAATLDSVSLLIIGAAARPIAAAEAEAVALWVERGGALLLLTDHEPFATPAEALARAFDVGLSGEMIAGEAAGDPRLRFLIRGGALDERPRRIRTYGGQAVWRERRPAQLLLPLPAPVRAIRRGVIEAPAPMAQLIAFEAGAGRVVVSGESGLFGAQEDERGPFGVNDPATDNEDFVVARLRWLLQLERAAMTGDPANRGPPAGGR